ncbi:choline transport protein [Ceratobasidium sp. AG-Ba]|nr:choline transport protein [Ceratobasidium sp. AG-Ba]
MISLSHLARPRRTGLHLIAQNLRQTKAKVFYNNLHSLPPSIGDTTVAIPKSAMNTLAPAVIPAGSRRGRNLILCFDGTGEQYDKDYSNIVRFVRLLKKGDPSQQMVYYQPGVGTGIGSSGPSNPFLKQIFYRLDQAFATGLPMHVRGGYEFLMNNYEEGDRISLFGFSRGAYTARALAGMLHKVGLLTAHNKEQIDHAYQMYKRDDEEGWTMSAGFKDTFSIDVKIDFVGVFDTVNSVGLIPRELPFARSNYLISVFRHAVALDERRGKFKAHLWGQGPGYEEKTGDRKHENCDKPESYGWISTMRNSIPSRIWAQNTANFHTSTRKNGHDFATPEERRHKTNVKEVWFAGTHSDVGGGSVPNGTPNHLARIPLRWMIRECFANNTGILFERSRLEAIGLNVAALQQLVKAPASPELEVTSTKEGNKEETSNKVTKIMTPANNKVPGLPKFVPNEAVRLITTEDEKDAVEPIHDQLSRSRWWWIMELLPMKYQKHDGTLRSWLSMNLGKARTIHGQQRFPTYVHKSVLYRMQKTGYKPHAKLLENPAPSI